MIDETPQIATVGDDEPRSQGVSGNFSAPLSATTQGRLVFASAASDVRIDANPHPTELYTAHFEEHLPSVRVQEGTITIQYRRHLPLDWLTYKRQSLARFALNSTIPWEIEFRDGLSRLIADLRQLHLCSVDMSSVSSARLSLPVPVAAANIYLSGSASDLTLHRPSAVALRLHITGAASNLSLDGQRLGASGGGLRWQSQNYHDSANRYDVGIAGSVSNLTIDTFEADI